MHGLTAKQFLWAEHYIQTRNGTKAAKLAGYKGNDNVLAGIGHANIRNPKIMAYLSKRYAAVAMSSDEVLMLLAKLARADISHYMQKGGGIDWDKVATDGYAVKSVQHLKGKHSKLEIEPRLRALELIGKVHGLYITKLAPTDPTGEKEYGADTRTDLISRLLPELAIPDTGGETGEAD